MTLGLLFIFANLYAVADPSCSLETVRQPWDATEYPALFYADLNCPSESGRVDDSAIWHSQVDMTALAQRNSTTDIDAYTHVANKSIGGLQRPSGLMVAGGNLLWVEQDAGELEREGR